MNDTSLPFSVWILGILIGIAAMLCNGAIILLAVSGRVKADVSNILITNMAVADFLTGLVLIALKAAPPLPAPTETSTLMWIYCSIYWSELPLWSLINTSIFNLSLITMERYFAVIRPVFRRSIQPKTLIVVLSLTSAWLLGIFVSSSMVFFWEVEDNKCVIAPVGRWLWIVAGCWAFFGMLVVPFCFMLLVYIYIGLHIYKMPAQTKGRNSQMKMTIVCLTLLTAFLICWLPDQTFYFLYTVEPFKLDLSVNSSLYYFVVNLGFFNSVLNPFLYGFLNPSFSAAFRNILRPTQKRTAVQVSTELATSSESQREKTNRLVEQLTSDV